MINNNSNNNKIVIYIEDNEYPLSNINEATYTPKNINDKRENDNC